MNQGMAFGVCMAVGLVLMSLSFVYLPMILIAPQNFSGLFSLGSLCFFIGFAALQGPAEFASHLLKKGRLPLSLSYVGSLIACLCSANILGSYILTLVFTGIHIVALLYFLSAFVPGGTDRLTSILTACWSFLRGLCGGKSSSPLPL